MILFTNKQIQNKLKQIAANINERFRNDEITLLIILTGGAYTGIDLSRYLTIPCKLEFVKISSYGNEEISTEVNIEWISCKSKELGNIVIIDDICDTGKTLIKLKEYLEMNYNCKDILTCTLLDKPKRREVDISPDYSGFILQDTAFVYGYGLDNSGYQRNLVDIREKE